MDMRKGEGGKGEYHNSMRIKLDWRRGDEGDQQVLHVIYKPYE
jgi:hypothetical protein